MDFFDKPVSWMVLLGLSSGLPLAIRCLPSTGRSAARSGSKQEWGTLGVWLLQDLVLGAGTALLVTLVAAALRRPWLGACVGGLGILVVHAVVLADFLIRRQTGLRFTWQFLSFLKVLHCFGTSARRGGGLGLGTLAVLSGVYGVCFVGLLAWVFTQLGVPKPDLALAAMVAVLGLGSVLAGTRCEPAALWEQQNIWFLLLRGLFPKARTREAGVVEPPGDLIRRVSPTERFTLLDPARPLLRRTLGYEGARGFDLDLRGDPPHVLLLFMESFCASTVGVIGADVGASPEFDRLAKEGVLFRQFYATGVQTARAVVSGLFGIPPRFTEKPVQADQRGCPRLIGLPDFFGELGYHTAYLHNGFLEFEEADVFCRSHGFRELCGQAELRQRYSEAEIVGGWGVPDEFLMRYCVEWLEGMEKQGQPAFGTLFTMSNHHPFEVPAGFVPPPLHFPGNPEKEDFLGTFAYSDACLGLLLRLLRERGLDRRCVVFILADTAQPLGEHDNWGVQVGLYEENLRIPLLILAPGRLRAPVVVDEPASQMDLLPTFIDLFGRPFVHHASGTSLLRLGGERPLWFNNPFGLGHIGQRLGPMKVVHECRTGNTRAHDLRTDPGEKVNLAASGDPRVKALEGQLLAAHAVVQRLYVEDRFC